MVTAIASISTTEIPHLHVVSDFQVFLSTITLSDSINNHAGVPHDFRDSISLLSPVKFE
ncbi:unnamed protein product [Arabis nemorensis]|uniref:Uncharacterized protein n=1 Tax=Arabis nemorensis TaxID=586526 RepID=A0A565C536_9BRAS|nr:unnamed protein product [Arabis nemorensis]